MVASAPATLAGKVGSVYIVPFGTAAPFTIPPSASFDATNVTLPAAWSNGDLGYLHEDDTPTMHWDYKTQPIAAWQTNGNPFRILAQSKVRGIKFTCREINKPVLGLVEPGATFTAGAAGSNTVTVPNSTTNPDKAGLFKIQDLDLSTFMWIYIPKLNITDIGDLKFDRQDTANTQLTFQFLSPTGLTTDPLYYIASNHAGLQ